MHDGIPDQIQSPVWLMQERRGKGDGGGGEKGHGSPQEATALEKVLVLILTSKTEFLVNDMSRPAGCSSAACRCASGEGRGGTFQKDHQA